jgi:hypothetical protein
LPTSAPPPASGFDVLHIMDMARAFVNIYDSN